MLKAKFYYYNSEELRYAIAKFENFNDIATITNVNEDYFVISATFSAVIDIYFLAGLTRATKIEEIEE